MPVFRIHYTEHGSPKTKDVVADTADAARSILKPKGDTSIHINKVKVIR